MAKSHTFYQPSDNERMFHFFPKELEVNDIIFFGWHWNLQIVHYIKGTVRDHNSVGEKSEQMS